MAESASGIAACEFVGVKDKDHACYEAHVKNYLNMTPLSSSVIMKRVTGGVSELVSINKQYTV